MTQQTFVLVKTSNLFVFRRCLDQDKYIPPGHTSSEDVFKTPLSRRIYWSQSYVPKTSSRRLQDVLNTSLKRLQDVCEDAFKTSCKNVFKTFSRHFQDVFKFHYQVKLFLLTRLHDVLDFDTYCEDDYLQKNFLRLHFSGNYGQGKIFPRVSNFLKTFYEVTASTIKIFLLGIRKYVNKENKEQMKSIRFQLFTLQHLLVAAYSGIFGTQSDIYHGTFLRKSLTAFSY